MATATPTPDPATASFFADVRLRSEEALAVTGRDRRDYRIGGGRLRLCFAGDELASRLAPAFEHLRCRDETEADLVVHLFDSASSVVRLPPRPWSDKAYLPRTEVEGYTTGRYRASVSAVGGSVSLLDVEAGWGAYWIDDARALPHYERGSPLLAILHWWMRERGVQLVHAAAVGTRDGAALLVGKGGSGKSTSALACLGSRLGYLGDDYCLVEAGRNPRVMSAYATGKLHASNRFAPPGLERVHVNAAAPGEKKVFALAAAFRDALLAEAPLLAVLLPSPSGDGATTWRPLAAAAALAAAAPSTVLQLPGAGREAFATLGEILRRVPAFHLSTGTDLDGIPVAIAELLEGLRGQGEAKRASGAPSARVPR